MISSLKVNLLNRCKKVKSLKNIEKRVVEKIFKKNDFNIKKTCKELKIGRPTFYLRHRDLIEKDKIKRKEQNDKNRRKKK